MYEREKVARDAEREREREKLSFKTYTRWIIICQSITNM